MTRRWVPFFVAAALLVAADGEPEQCLLQSKAARGKSLPLAASKTTEALQGSPSAGTAAKHQGLNSKQSSYGGLADGLQKHHAQIPLELRTETSSLHVASKFIIAELNEAALAQIGTMTEKPLGFGLLPVQVQLDIDSPPNVDMTHNLFCNSFHKTGTEVCQQFSLAYAQVSGQPFVDCLYSEAECEHGASVSTNYHVLGGPEILVQGPYLELNWIREPVSLILSAFRYHNGVAPPEKWATKPETCMDCYEEDRSAMFGLCTESCTYTELLNSVANVNETAGVIIEALNERRNIATMLDKLVDTANDPRVLHLSVDHLKKDFTQTMRCINAFLGGKGLAPEQLEIFQSFNPDSDNFAGDDHVTTGKYDNTLLKQFLLGLPIWAAEFANVSRLFSEIFQRQTVKYGCPMP